MDWNKTKAWLKKLFTESLGQTVITIFSSVLAIAVAGVLNAAWY